MYNMNSPIANMGMQGYTQNYYGATQFDPLSQQRQIMNRQQEEMQYMQYMQQKEYERTHLSPEEQEELRRQDVMREHALRQQQMTQQQIMQQQQAMQQYQMMQQAAMQNVNVGGMGYNPNINYQQPQMMNTGYNPMQGLQQPGIQNFQPINPYMNSTGIQSPISRGYFNPYINNARQQQLMQQQAMQQQQQQNDIWRRLTRSAYKSCGEEISDEDLDSMYNPQPMQMRQMTEEEYEYQNTLRLGKLHAELILGTGPKHDPYAQARQYQYNVSAGYKAQFPDDMDMFDYLNNAHKILADKEEQEFLAQQKDLRQLFNQQRYKELIKQSSTSRDHFFRQPMSEFQNIVPTGMNSISIKAPDNIVRERELAIQQRLSFMHSITDRERKI